MAAPEGSTTAAQCSCAAGWYAAPVVAASAYETAKLHVKAHLAGSSSSKLAVKLHSLGTTLARSSAANTNTRQPRCLPCVEDYYCPGFAGASLKNPCPQHTTTLGAKAATTLSDCKCKAGWLTLAASSLDPALHTQLAPTDPPCRSCPANSYCPDADTRIPCPPHAVSMAGSIDEGQCVCGSRFEEIDGACEPLCVAQVLLASEFHLLS